jgi:hypothetical protein
MADWQWVVLFLLFVFVLSMRGRGNRGSGPQRERRETWGQRLNRKAADPFDSSDPFATRIRQDREQLGQVEVTGPHSKRNTDPGGTDDTPW